MKAAQVTQYGDASVMKINEVDKPSAGPGHVLVEVHASSLNPFDTSVRAGYMKDAIPLQLPFTLGGDIAGIVTEVGEGVTNVSVGDKVYGQANIVAGNSGAFAEYAVTKAEQVAQAPANIGFNEAGSLPLVGVSALQGITEEVGLQAGQKVFIHGGAGGIGSIAIQIAKHIGAHVTTTATGEAMEKVKQFGADEVVDYKAQDFGEVLRDCDAVFDTVGGDDFTKTLSVLKRGGIAVSMVAEADQARVAELGVSVKRQGTQVTTARLNALRELVELGAVKPAVGKVFALDDIQAAMEARESGISGKVVLTVKS
jgi:NADPH:quinone reductase-like Zn-dependent oxidoreductase